MLQSTMEMQDVVDENDIVVATMSRDEIWQKGLEHNVRAVNVFVVDQDNRILLPVRSFKKKNWPGCYDFACGENLQAGETYEDGLVRGMKEELGLDNYHHKFLFKLTPKDGEVCFLKVYEVKVDSSSLEFTLDPDEVDHLEWKTVEEVKELVVQFPDKFKRGYPQLFNRYLSVL